MALGPGPRVRRRAPNRWRSIGLRHHGARALARHRAPAIGGRGEGRRHQAREAADRGPRRSAGPHRRRQRAAVRRPRLGHSLFHEWPDRRRDPLLPRRAPARAVGLSLRHRRRAGEPGGPGRHLPRRGPHPLRGRRPGRRGGPGQRAAASWPARRGLGGGRLLRHLPAHRQPARRGSQRPVRARAGLLRRHRQRLPGQRPGLERGRQADADGRGPVAQPLHRGRRQRGMGRARSVVGPALWWRGSSAPSTGETSRSTST